MFDTYTASDYAGLSGGAYDFYYGYEVTDKDDNWLFVAKVSGTEVARWTAEQIGIAPDHDPHRILMRGIAKFLDTVSTGLDGND